jgi:hypothetical protein
MSFWTRSQDFLYRIVAKILSGTPRKKRSGRRSYRTLGLAQGKGPSAPPEWMPFPDEGEISRRAADSRVEVPVQTSGRVTRERVPQIITKDWTKANRDRANEVTLQLEPRAMYTLNDSEHGR